MMLEHGMKADNCEIALREDLARLLGLWKRMSKASENGIPRHIERDSHFV
tara:strand:+ start:92 stop:241 length:150 start_codon:yes stop_codon:yes gene_type:complete